jgi:hypothetical protein
MTRAKPLNKGVDDFTQSLPKIPSRHAVGDFSFPGGIFLQGLKILLREISGFSIQIRQEDYKCQSMSGQGSKNTPWLSRHDEIGQA